MDWNQRSAELKQAFLDWKVGQGSGVGLCRIKRLKEINIAGRLKEIKDEFRDREEE